jgi:hypothetical protein
MLAEPSAGRAFAEGWHRVPVWPFLRWIPQVCLWRPRVAPARRPSDVGALQLLAMLNGPQGDLACDVLVAIARAYPQALYFPFSVTRVDLQFAADSAYVAMRGRAICVSQRGVCSAGCTREWRRWPPT